MDIKISVIIPVYNGKNKISRCLEQLNNQSFKEDFEVIVVDDASSDGSAGYIKKCISILEKKHIFKIIECEKNGRAGKARNLGVNAAEGRYILFIDQDDYPDIRMLEELYVLTMDGMIDCVSCNVMEKNNQVYNRPHLDKTDILNNDDKRNLVRNHGYVFAMLVKRKIITSNNLYFPENVMFEDVLFNIGIFSCVKTFRHTEKALYFRTADDNSQTSSLNLKKLKDRISATEWYVSNFTGNIYVKPFWNEVIDTAFYYIFLSCVYWMLFNNNLYSYKLFLKCRQWGINNNASWKRIFNIEKRFSYLKLRILKLIYDLPVFLPVFYFSAQTYKRVRNTIKKCLNKNLL